jgi:hypothetical protein
LSIASMSVAERGRVELDRAELERQVAVLRGPAPTLRLHRPAAVGDGIRRLDPRTFEPLESFHEHARRAGRITTFVPASGAATRLCKDLLVAWKQGSPAIDDAEVHDVVRGAPSLAIWPSLVERGARAGDARSILDALVGPSGLRLQDVAKALVPFHRDPAGRPRTAFEEHLVEATALGRDDAGRVRVHFTVGAEHLDAFQQALADARRRLESELAVRLVVTFSVQDPRTDTIAVDTSGQPVREADGTLLRRPGGHGALLGNLAALGADVVLVKNVDNVVPEELRGPNLPWRARLSGMLLRLVGNAHELVHALREGRRVAEAYEFVRDELGLDVPAIAGRLIDRLDRPWRVCGMVQVDGHVGGGPFWADSPDGISPQIVEAIQVGADDAQQRVLHASTHFNPVDMALALRDADGRPHDLTKWVDATAEIVSEKVQDTRTLRVLEHPGLWNGGMARWNTVFVEVPASTFQPVKTLRDLLREGHGGPLP